MKSGDKVTPRFELTDYDGSPFHKAEIGTIIKTTHSTIHVEDPRRHVHIRYRRDFSPASRKRGHREEA